MISEDPALADPGLPGNYLVRERLPHVQGVQVWRVLRGIESGLFEGADPEYQRVLADLGYRVMRNDHDKPPITGTNFGEGLPG